MFFLFQTTYEQTVLKIADTSSCHGMESLSGAVGAIISLCSHSFLIFPSIACCNRKICNFGVIHSQSIRGGIKIKNYKTYNRSARVVFSNKCLSQATFNKRRKNSNDFDFNYSEAISSLFSLFRAISAYLGYLKLSGSIIK